jgi:hypothetical protein
MILLTRIQEHNCGGPISDSQAQYAPGFNPKETDETTSSNEKVASSPSYRCNESKEITRPTSDQNLEDEDAEWLDGYSGFHEKIISDEENESESDYRGWRVPDDMSHIDASVLGSLPIGIRKSVIEDARCRVALPPRSSFILGRRKDENADLSIFQSLEILRCIPKFNYQTFYEVGKYLSFSL